jgi:deoxycytidine triphosphate deaminase
MAASHGMIEPFEPGQVRVVAGQRIVSYGTSSYGYDVRCAGEFKIFTNINSTIVDPKAFDRGSFVDFEGDVCIIPPNSFALARTVGWIAQWKELIADPEQKLSRPRQLFTGSVRRDVLPIAQR